ncbi:hypothetical protein JOF43_000103 [Brachybacterium sacelli]|uniref:Uncharacterized protein n=1 Tax=Brachybacterium sacelli TaxID=173364 RepID=A0ABS4WVH1_9MICO|nr:hypothetical protein [Brachybacterium sacelli]
MLATVRRRGASLGPVVAGSAGETFSRRHPAAASAARALLYLGHSTAPLTGFRPSFHLDVAAALSHVGPELMHLLRVPVFQ